MSYTECSKYSMKEKHR